MLIRNNPASIRRRVIGLPLLSPHLSPFADRITGYYPSGSLRISLGLQMAKTHKQMVCVCVRACVRWAFCLNTECESTAVSFQVIIIFYHYCFLWGCFNISTAYASICGTNSRGLRSPESLSTAEQAFQWMDSWWERTQKEEVCAFLTGRDRRKYFRLNKLVIGGHDIIFVESKYQQPFNLPMLEDGN